MNTKFKITIPKPCHENWNKMTPKEKGRFCSSCAKTVVDFTKKSTGEIQEYLIENKNQRVCGHFYRKQLDTITIEIPQETFYQQLSFQKLFVLSLFFAMGTTLFSCQYSNGKKQKIENVILKDSIEIVDEDLGLIIPIENKLDTIPENIIMGKTPTIEIVGDIAAIEGEIELEEIIGFIIIDEPPRFKTSKKLSKEKAKQDFDDKMKQFVTTNLDFEFTNNLGLSTGKHRIFTQFAVDKKGNVTDIKVRAPHPKIKKEVTKMLQELPQFIPGKQAGKVVKTKYSLPITFVVE